MPSANLHHFPTLQQQTEIISDIINHLQQIDPTTEPSDLCHIDNLITETQEQPQNFGYTTENLQSFLYYTFQDSMPIGSQL